MSNSSWYEVIGVSLIGPPPIGTIHLPWEQGLRVLYGRNGAGKSRILEALLALERGQKAPESRSFLHIRYDPETTFDSDDPGELETLCSAIGHEALDDVIAEAAAMPASEDLAGIESYFLEYFLEEEKLGGFFGAALDPFDLPMLNPNSKWNPLEKAILESNTLSLEPGSGVWASAIVSKETPGLRDILAGIRNLDVASTHHFGLQGGKPWDEGMSGSHLYGWTAWVDWPSWVPVPLKRLLSGEHGLDLIRLESGSGDDPDAGSNQTAKSLIEHFENSETKGGLDVSEFLGDFFGEWSSEATDRMQSMLIDAPALKIELLPISSWLEGSIVAWSAKDPFTGEWLPLSWMSSAQRKWAEVAIYLGQLAVTSQMLPEDNTGLVIDEPEQALHPAAIDYLLEELQATANRLGGPVLMASHSPQVLSLPSARLLHVVRDRNHSTAINELTDELASDVRSTAETMGLRPIDLLHVYRVFLVVEGAHDSAVLETVFPGEWDSHRIRLLHMKGTSHLLDVAGSELLRDFSDAHLVVLLDDVATEVTSGLSEAMANAMDGRAQEANAKLAEIESMAGHAERKAVEFARTVINLARNYVGHPTRFHVKGLAKRDIIEYLDPHDFRLTKSWSSLRTEYKQEGKGTDFKDWLRASRAASINTDLIRESASALSDHPPTEFTEILRFCVELSTASG